MMTETKKSLRTGAAKILSIAFLRETSIVKAKRKAKGGRLPMLQPKHRRSRPIILVGFMGVGKTTVGTLLAERLGRPLKDSDQEIEKRMRMTITAIFAQYGEPRFREIEREVVAELCRRKKPAVISLGGGAFVQEQTRRICLESGTVVHLELSWPLWAQRMEQLKNTRPLLQSKTMEEIRALYETRSSVYRMAHHTVKTDGLNADAIADRIIGLIT